MDRTQLKTPLPDLICYSHLRWDFVFQRPQHLMSRFARERTVHYVQEPRIEPGQPAQIKEAVCSQTGVRILEPCIPSDGSEMRIVVARMMQEYMRSQRIADFIAWFYTPMWLDFLPPDFQPAKVVYDCMDELSLFQGASERLRANETRLLKLADLVFTGGVSLYEAKKSLHSAAHPFPSGVDVLHFARARSITDEVADQAEIPHPRLGFAGVIDERMDLDLVREVARLRPDWHFVMLGPIVKIDPATLPRGENLHWLGMKNYQHLPAYFAGWDLATMPFALNDSTRFISPTKTPEYLAAGLPVVSTPIRDVVRPYGELGLVRIASTPAEFVSAAEKALSYGMGMKWRERADAFLETMSWDSVWSAMNVRIREVEQASPAQGENTRQKVEGEIARV